MTESRELVKIEIDELDGNSVFTFAEGNNFKSIRVFPASRFYGGALSLTPEELNQAVQMWINKKESQTTSEKIARKMCEDHDHGTTISFLCKKIVELEKQLRDYPLKTLYERQDLHWGAFLESNSKRMAEIEELKKKVKALEDQHREPDPEKYECIDLGFPFQKIYIKKLKCDPSLSKVYYPGYCRLCIHSRQPPNVCPYVLMLKEHGSERTKCPKHDVPPEQHPDHKERK